MAARYAVSLLALFGAASAQGYSNSSTSAVLSSSSSSANSTALESPTMTSSGVSATQTYADGAKPTVAGVSFLIQTDTSYTGTTISLLRKRASNAGINTCLAACAASSSCVGTAYDENSGICTFYSSIDDGSEMDEPGTTFATVENRAAVSSSTARMNSTSSVKPGSGSPSSTKAYGNSTTKSTGLSSTRGMASMTKSATSSSTSTAATPVNTPSGLLNIAGVEFLIEVNITYSGIFIEIDILTKRDGYTLQQCLTTCANNTDCVGTAYNANTTDCTFYSSIDKGSRTTSVGTTFGTVLYRSNNSTIGGGNTNPNATAETLICPAYNGHVITSSVDVGFAIGCGEFLVGTTFDITLDLAKRQAMDTGLPQTLSNCVDLCSLSETCVGTVFNIASGTCSYYSAVSYALAVDGYDAATRVASNNADSTTTTTATVTATVTAGITAGPGVTVGPGTTLTATVYTTQVSTVYVYAGDAQSATAYPNGAVVTKVVAVGTTSYANSIPTSTLAMPTVTVYVGSGSAAGAAGAAAAAAYPTVTVHDTVTYCPAQQTTWTTVYYA